MTGPGAAETAATITETSYPVLCTLWGVVSQFARPQSESLFVFVFRRLRLSPSQCQVVGPVGFGCLSIVLHRGSGNHRGVRVLSLCCTLYSLLCTCELDKSR